MNTNTTQFAEICGIHAGDGYLRNDGRRRELDISGSIEEQPYYDDHVIPLFNSFFGLKISGRLFPSRQTYGFVIRDPSIIQTLHSAGFPYGNKSTIVDVPSFILNSPNLNLHRAFLRGLFDTDGCINFDKKIRNSDIFKKTRHFYPRILFTTVSEKLAIGVKLLAEKQDFSCKVYRSQPAKSTEHLKFKPQIVGSYSILQWMEKINPKNPIKTSRFSVWEEFNFCPPNTTYKQRLQMLGREVDPQSFYA